MGQQAGEDVLQGYQLLPERAGGPRAAPSRVLPTDKDARTDKAVLLYRDTDGWCPFCERVSWNSSPSRHHQLQRVHMLGMQQPAGAKCLLCQKRYLPGLQWPQSKVKLSTLRCMLSFDGAAALQVWLALEEKGIPYDTMFINLRKKPDWFKDVVPTNKVPAVSINGQMVWESDAILEVSVARLLVRCAPAGLSKLHCG